jgi:hypothetical protein
MIWDVHPVSGFLSHPRFWIQGSKSTGSRIRNSDLYTAGTGKHNFFMYNNVLFVVKLSKPVITYFLVQEHGTVLLLRPRSTKPNCQKVF